MFSDTHSVSKCFEWNAVDIKTIVYKTDTNSIMDTLSDIHRILFPDINVVLSGNESFIEDVMTKVHI